MSRKKKFSVTLKEARGIVGLSPDEMSSLLGAKVRMYKQYEAGKWDNNVIRSWHKEKILFKLDAMDIEINKKILALQMALKRLEAVRKKNGKKNGKTGK